MNVLSFVTACEVGGDMDQLRLTVCTLAGGYVSLHKAKVEPMMATLHQDPFLRDMSKKRPSVKEIETLMGVGKPSAMMLCIQKLDGTKLGESSPILREPMPLA